MWRLLPLVFLLGCMATDPKPSGGTPDVASGPRILRIVDLPLSAPTPGLNGSSSMRSFRGSGYSGHLESTGDWRIRAEVHHGRLRCGTYEVGMQFGRGNAQCTDVRWIIDVDYVTSERHCNSATRIHTGSGRISGNRLEDANCARAVLRCQGTC